MTPFGDTVANRLSRLLQRKSVKVVTGPPLKVKQLLHPVKDSLGVNIPGVY